MIDEGEESRGGGGGVEGAEKVGDLRKKNGGKRVRRVGGGGEAAVAVHVGSRSSLSLYRVVSLGRRRGGRER